MRVALLTEPRWLQAEVPTLQRLAVALIDEQVQIIPIVPDEFDTDEADLSVTTRPVRYESSRWRWLRDWRIGRLLPSLETMEIDVLHALDASLELAVQKLAAKLGVPAVCSVWSASGIERLEGPQPDGPPAMVYVAPTAPLVQRCASLLAGAAPVELVRPGVFVGADAAAAPPLQHPDNPLSILVVGDGHLDAAYRALLEGMANARDRMGAAMYFFYAVGEQQHKLWQAAESLGLQRQVSWVPVGASSRELLVQADVVVLPQATGVVRSIVLEAMRAGRPVIAAADPMLDYLIDGETARLVQQPGGAEWSRALLGTRRDREALIALGLSGQAYVATHHSVTQQAAATLALYRRSAPPSIPFAP